MATKEQIEEVRKYLFRLNGNYAKGLAQVAQEIADMLREQVPETDEELVLNALKAYWPGNVTFSYQDKSAMGRALSVLQSKHVEDVKKLMANPTEEEWEFVFQNNQFLGFKKCAAKLYQARLDNYLNPPKQDPAVEAVVAMGYDILNAEKIVAAVRKSDHEGKR